MIPLAFSVCFFLALLDTARVQRSVSFLGLLCRMPVPILKHRLELQGISHVVSLVSFSDVKAFEENNFTGFTSKRRLKSFSLFALYIHCTVHLFFRYLIIRLT